MSQFPAGDLIALARANPSDRDATLLKAATALYCQEPAHDRDAIRRYEQLAIHFLPEVRPPDRAYVAELLGARADAPPAVVRMLARDVIDVASPVLRQSPVLSSIDLLGVIAATGPEHHQLIALREHLSEQVMWALNRAAEEERPDFSRPNSAAEPAPSPAAEPAAGGAIDLALTGESPEADPGASEREAGSDPIGEAPAAAPASPPVHDLGHFLDLPSHERVRTLGRMAGIEAARLTKSPHRQLDSALRHAYATADIVVRAKANDQSGLILAFAASLELDPILVRRLVTDPSGEPLVLLCKAAGLSEADGRTVLLLANPLIGQSVETFFRLADLLATVERAVAEQFVAAWREPRPSQVRYVPLTTEVKAYRSGPARSDERPAAATIPERRAVGEA